MEFSKTFSKDEHFLVVRISSSKAIVPSQEVFIAFDIIIGFVYLLMTL